jgi:fumarate hydratase class II
MNDAAIPATVDVALIGPGIMSATVGALLKALDPSLCVAVFERLEYCALESSAGWNNAGTGHAANCELNYTPEAPDGSIDISKVLEVNVEFDLSSQLWSYFVCTGAIHDPSAFKVGRTHLEDATPLSVGQEWSGWAAQLRACVSEIEHACEGLYELAIGGTAVGTGLNAPKGFSKRIAARIDALTSKPFVTAPNKFMAQGSLDAMVRASAALRGTAAALMKIANDMRWLASGPRCGLGKLKPPAMMIAIQVIGEDTAITFAGSQGNFELNAMRPIIINNFLHSATILADGCEKFRTFSVEGAELDRARIAAQVENTLMLVTALSPAIGYQNAAHIAEDADATGSTLREAALRSGKVSAAEYDKIIVPTHMIGDGLAGA